MNVVRKILPTVFRPELFTHKTGTRNFFENWLIKLVSEDRKHVIVLIPVLELGKKQRFYFEILEGTSGKTYVTYFKLSEFESSKQTMDFRFGNNRFTQNGIELNIKNEELNLTGNVSFGKLNPFPSKGLNQNILGYFNFIPFYNIFFAIVSMHHGVNGSLTLNKQTYNFDNGTSFINKSWGRQYPKTWLFIECNTFNIPDTYFLLTASMLDLKLYKSPATLSYLYYKGELINLSFYSGAKIVRFSKEGKILILEMKKKNLNLEINLIPKNQGKIRVPSPAEDRYIYESADSTLHLNVYRDGKLEASIEGERAGYDMVEGLSDLLKTNP